MDDEKGLSCLEKCISYANDDWVEEEEHQEVLVDLMACLWRLGRENEGKKYQEAFLEIQKEQFCYDSCQEL